MPKNNPALAPDTDALLHAAPDMEKALRLFVATMDSLPACDETSLRVWDVYHDACRALAKLETR